MKKILFYTTLIILPIVTFAQNVTPEKILEIQSNFINQVAAVNLGYLSVAVTILLIFGGAFYLFNFKPLQESIRKQEEDLKESRGENIHEISILKNEALSEIEKIRKEIEVKITERVLSTEGLFKSFEERAKKEMNMLREKSNKLELEAIWTQHYLWSNADNVRNELDTLMDYMEKGQEYKITYLFDLCLQEIDEVFDRIEKKDIVGDRFVTQERLLKILSGINGFEEIKTSIKNKAKKIF